MHQSLGSALSWGAFVVQAQSHLVLDLGRGGGVKVGAVLEPHPFGVAGELLVDAVGVLREGGYQFAAAIGHDDPLVGQCFLKGSELGWVASLVAQVA